MLIFFTVQNAEVKPVNINLAYLAQAPIYGIYVPAIWIVQDLHQFPVKAETFESAFDLVIVTVFINCTSIFLVLTSDVFILILLIIVGPFLRVIVI